jgi:hypothetical protein
VTNSKRVRIFERLDDSASPMTIKREFDDRLEACGWLYILKLAKEYSSTRGAKEQASSNVVKLPSR